MVPAPSWTEELTSHLPTHFIDEEVGLERLSEFPNTTQLIEWEMDLRTRIYSTLKVHFS